LGLARFTAKHPYNPTATKEKLEEILRKIHGVTDCTIHEYGDVTLEYDRHFVSDELIEDALACMGFKIKHTLDDLDASEADVNRALDE